MPQRSGRLPRAPAGGPRYRPGRAHGPCRKCASRRRSQRMRLLLERRRQRARGWPGLQAPRGHRVARAVSAALVVGLRSSAPALAAMHDRHRAHLLGIEARKLVTSRVTTRPDPIRLTPIDADTACTLTCDDAIRPYRLRRLRHASHRGGQGFESPQLHPEIAGQRTVWLW
jgi:hypothetical protein